ncbi:sugar phosphate isomerase/epimerase family protein [Streptomyces sp. NPDC059506]|uniref:sugar phosphate isomerase/epimerase family protein n=1 Tax=Streptomyces sp. NPDC059506 TaxID=3347751 RepID=UPI0036BD0866
MKFALSTLGLPGTPVDDVLRLAADSGFDGVELHSRPEGPVHPGTGAAERARITARSAEAGLTVLSVAAPVRAAGGDEDGPVIEELGEAVRLAADLGAPYVRVLPGGALPGDAFPGGALPGVGAPSAEEADVVAARRLAAVAPEAADRGVRILLETRGSHPRGADVARITGLVGHRAVGVVWDPAHTRHAGEEPHETLPVLAPHLGYVRVKDSAPDGDAAPPPLRAAVRALRSHGYDGWLCWEHGEQSYADAPEPGRPAAAARNRLAALADGSAA